MTPLDSGSATIARAVRPRTTLRIGLGPPDPAHLPLIAAAAWGLFADHDVAVAIDTVVDCARGGAPAATPVAFARLAAGDLDAVAASPLALAAAGAGGGVPLAGLLRTEGGVLVRNDRLAALCEGDTLDIIAIAAPAPEGLCRRLLQNWAAGEGLAVAGETIRVGAGAAGDAIAALAAGADGVWPARAAIEAAAAAFHGLPVRLITAQSCGLPEIAGLDLIARPSPSAGDAARLDRVIAALGEAVRRLKADPARAVGLWQAHGGGQDEDAAAVVRAMLPSLSLPPECRADRWQGLQDLLLQLRQHGSASG